MAIASTVLYYIFSTNKAVPGQKLTQCRSVSFRVISNKCPVKRSNKAFGTALLQPGL